MIFNDCKLNIFSCAPYDDYLLNAQVKPSRVGSGRLLCPVQSVSVCHASQSVCHAVHVGQFISQCQSVTNISQSDSYVSQSVCQTTAVSQTVLAVSQTVQAVEVIL